MQLHRCQLPIKPKEEEETDRRRTPLVAADQIFLTPIPRLGECLKINRFKRGIGEMQLLMRQNLQIPSILSNLTRENVSY